MIRPPLFVRLYALAATIVTVAGCGIEPPAAESLPVPGLPDWNASEYTWLLTQGSICDYYGVLRSSWEPQFSLSVEDCSFDGKKLLVRLNDRIALYDIASGSLTTVLHEKCEFAALARTSSKVVAYRSVNVHPAYKVVIVDVATGESYRLPLPDSTRMIAPVVRWLPGDTCVGVGILFPSDTQSHLWSIGSTPPHGIRLSAWPYFDDYDSRRGFRNGPDALMIGPISDTAGWGRLSFRGIVNHDGAICRVSPNGRYLACSMQADLTGTRFDGGDHAVHRVNVLGIVDVAADDPTAIDLYRVFVDHTHAVRNCSLFDYSAHGAWSPDGKHFYHERIRRSDSTMQIVRLDVRTGRTTELTNWTVAP